MEAPQPSGALLRLFSLYVRRTLRKHFHGVRLAADSPALPRDGKPLVVYVNHPSWWDPLVGLRIARTQMPDREHFAAIDAAALERYRFFRRLGFFGVEQGTRAGARTFLETSQHILARDRSVLWLTPEGRFSDPRDASVPLAPGLAHLCRHLERGHIVPLALEYPFWEERLPEALARFGEPLAASALAGMGTAAIADTLRQRLHDARDRLARQAIARDPSAFVSLLVGDVGVGGVYDRWCALRARLRGESFEPEHAAVVRRSALRTSGEGSR